MVNRRPYKLVRGLIAASLSLSVLLLAASCQSFLEEMIDIYNSVEDDVGTVDTDVPEDTYISLPPTGTYTSSTAETSELVYSYVKSIFIYSVWYD
ncbi:MAG: hypothetical protein IIT90_06605, partial [Clostridiales bacterium]|nr:hypothetical protein [Clostridiales bacterium]